MGSEGLIGGVSVVGVSVVGVVSLGHMVPSDSFNCSFN